MSFESHNMNPWILSTDWVARVSLVFCIACFYAGCVLINNNLLFFWAQDSSYRYWIYLPAGVRLVLVMLFGWRGLIGLAIAVTAIGFSKLVPEIERMDHAVLAAIVRAGSIWLAFEFYGRVTKIKSPWGALTWAHVPFLALFVSSFSAIAVTLLLIYLELETMEAFARNVTAWVLGDTVGTMIVLAVVIGLRHSYVKWKSKIKGAPSAP